MSADLSLASVLETIVPPILAGDGIVRHESHVELKGHRIRLRVIKRGPGFIGAIRCQCGECEVSRPRAGVEAALTAAEALAGKHGVHRRSK